MDEAELVGIHPFLYCLSIRVGFSVPPLDVVPVEISDYDLCLDTEVIIALLNSVRMLMLFASVLDVASMVVSVLTKMALYWRCGLNCHSHFRYRRASVCVCVCVCVSV